MLSTVLIVLAVVVIAALLFVIWTLISRRYPSFRIESDAPIEDLIPSLAGLSHGALIGGNSVELFENGAYWDTVLDDLTRAEASIHIENYIWEDGELSSRLTRILRERAEAGVVVRVLVDAFGSKGMSRETQDSLCDSGARVFRFHDGKLKKLGHQNERDHRKLIVVDGRTAYLGGHCIKDVWLGDARGFGEYRDVSLRLRGPAVHAAQSTFVENWIEETGEVFVGDAFFPPLDREGELAVHIARVKPTGTAAPAISVLYHLAICVARRRLYIQNPYFLPSDHAIDALGAAVARGVDVRIMTPTADASDMPFVQHAAHRNFSKLLRRGVRIYEFGRTLIHQKVITVDGVWCAIGSANFDERSLGINDELLLGIHDPATAVQLEEIFARDMRDAVELDLETWAARGTWHRLHDEAAFILRYQI